MSNEKWLLFSYSLPSGKPKARVGVWRKLHGLGAIQLKTSIHILPATEVLYERLMWLTGEVEDAGGEAAFFRCSGIENIADEKIERQFRLQSEKAYREVLGKCRELAGTLEKGPAPAQEKKIKTELRKLRKRFETLQEIDHFPGKNRAAALSALENLFEHVRILREDGGLPPKLQARDYSRRTWVTRSDPYVDRLGSYWLIKRFIDPQASFRFMDGAEATGLAGPEIGYDMREAQFTHKGELITFEVLMRSFGLQGAPFTRIGELVRHIDVEDGPSLPDDAILLKSIVDGLVSLHGDDIERSEAAMAVFDALYADLSRKERDFGREPDSP